MHGRCEPLCTPIISANMEKLPSRDSEKYRFVRNFILDLLFVPTHIKTNLGRDRKNHDRNRGSVDPYLLIVLHIIE